MYIEGFEDTLVIDQSVGDKYMFDYFKQRIKEELFTHPVITNNAYCNWFADATLTKSDVVFFTKQFSVFSKFIKHKFDPI